MDEERRTRAPLYRLLTLLACGIIVADQLSKAYFVYRLGTHGCKDMAAFAVDYFTLWGTVNGTGAIAAHYFPFTPGITVWNPWIELNLTTNSGAAWSLFTGNSFALSFVSIGMAALLFFIWWRSFRFHRGMTWALGAIIGGALGNFIDRFRLKEVVDFIDVRIPWIGQVIPALGDPYDFPIFNVADACAVMGTLALAAYLVAVDVRGLRGRRHAKRVARIQPRHTDIGLTVHIGIPGVEGGRGDGDIYKGDGVGRGISTEADDGD